MQEKDPGTEGLIDFLLIVGRLKRLPRTGWMEAGIKEPESVADHSFRTAVLAMILADLEGLNTDKAMRMALLHDLAEAKTGDLTPDQKSERGAAYASEERRASERILSTLPKALSAAYTSLLVEYNRGESAEALAVARADKLEMLLQALEYEGESVDKEGLERFWHTVVDGGLGSELLRELKRRSNLSHEI